MEHQTLTFKMETEQNLIAREVPSQRVLEISVQAFAPAAAARKDRAALNLALVLDRSGSMGGDKLEYVKQAALYVIDQLQESDRVAVVVYDNEVGLLWESTPVDEQARRSIKGRIQSLRPGGSTNLSGGWLAGCQQVAARQAEGQVNRVLLLTDGLANAGITDLEALGMHARELSVRGVATSTFGVGQGFNEQLLEQMANMGSGNFYYIATPIEIPDIFMREFQELAAVAARDVEVTLEIPAGVSAQVLGGWRCEEGAGKLRISLGSMAAGRQQDVYVNLLLPPGGRQPALLIPGKARGLDADGNVCEVHGEIAFRYAGSGEVSAAGAKEDLLARSAQVNVSSVANEALKLLRAGQPDQALRILERAIHLNGRNLSAEVRAEYEHMARRIREGMDERERKEAHYRNYRNYTGRE